MQPPALARHPLPSKNLTKGQGELAMDKVAVRHDLADSRLRLLHTHLAIHILCRVCQFTSHTWEARTLMHLLQARTF